MHFCQDELFAILAVIPGATMAYRWIRGKINEWRLRRAKVEENVCGPIGNA